MQPLADQMKHDFRVPIVRKVALDNMPLRNAPLPALVKNLSQIQTRDFFI